MEFSNGSVLRHIKRCWSTEAGRVIMNARLAVVILAFCLAFPGWALPQGSDDRPPCIICSQLCKKPQCVYENGECICYEIFGHARSEDRAPHPGK